MIKNMIKKILSFFRSEAPPAPMSKELRELCDLVKTVLQYFGNNVVSSGEIEGLRRRAKSVVAMYGSSKDPEVIELLTLANRLLVVMHDNRVSENEFNQLKRKCYDILLKHNFDK